MLKYQLIFYFFSSIIFIGASLYFCPNIDSQTINHKNFIVINKFEESGKIYFKGDFVDSIKYYISENVDLIEDINWDTCPFKINITDTIFPKKSCVLYIKSYSKDFDVPIFQSNIDYTKYIVNLISNYDHKLYDMLEISPNSPLRGTKLKVNNIRYQASAIFSSPVQKAICKNYDIELDLYSDSIPLTSSQIPKIKRIEFIKPNE